MWQTTDWTGLGKKALITEKEDREKCKNGGRAEISLGNNTDLSKILLK